jgi:hypothetical protein
MATKKKPMKRRATSKRAAGKKAAPKKKAAKKKLAKKKAAVKSKSPKRKAVSPKSATVAKMIIRGRGRSVDTERFPQEPREARNGELTGDLQGLSNLESADSESVDELLEEGNAFEAEAVKGVEDADEADEEEVPTHEVLEDDVPEEELDNQD